MAKSRTIPCASIQSSRLNATLGRSSSNSFYVILISTSSSWSFSRVLHKEYTCECRIYPDLTLSKNDISQWRMFLTVLVRNCNCAKVYACIAIPPELLYFRVFSKLTFTRISQCTYTYLVRKGPKLFQLHLQFLQPFWLFAEQYPLWFNGEVIQVILSSAGILRHIFRAFEKLQWGPSARKV